jgi:hypothetical protein
LWIADRPQRDIAAWLRSLPQLRALPAARLTEEKIALKAKNRLHSARQAKLAALKALQEAADPMLVAAKRSCWAAGLTFEGFTAGSLPDKAGVAIWGVRTTRGVHLMHLGPTAASLLDREGENTLAMIRLPLT